MTARITRRSALAAAITFAACSVSPAASDPISAAILRAEAADAAYRNAGSFARAVHGAGLILPDDWRPYRAGLLQARTAARFELHALTPATPEAAVALVAYYRDRAEVFGDPVAFRAARRRLRKVAQRFGAVALDITPLARASPI